MALITRWRWLLAGRIAPHSVIEGIEVHGHIIVGINCSVIGCVIKRECDCTTLPAAAITQR